MGPKLLEFVTEDELNLINLMKKAKLIGPELTEDSSKERRKISTSGAVIGSILGGIYGRDNDLRKQRRKMEDAAGNKVAESIKGIGKGKKK